MMDVPKKSRSFTSTANGRLRVLTSPCKVCAGFDPKNHEGHQHQDFHAIWDTGATGSVITKRIVDLCGLKPTGMVQTHGVHGMQLSPTYLVNVVLPNNVQFPNVRVTEGRLPGGDGGDLLIGMDIITCGDFSVTNKDGRTVFSFRYPSLIHTDYVAEHNAAQAVPPASRGPRPSKPKKAGKRFGRNKR